jgi:hypothetical protein
MARQEANVVLVNATYSSNAATVSNGLVYIPLPTTNTVFTDVIYIGDCNQRFLGAGVILNGILSSANCIVTLEQSYSLPAIPTENATFVAVQTVNITAVNTWNYVALLSATNAAITPYIRFKVASVTTSTSATVNIKVAKQVNG